MLNIFISLVMSCGFTAQEPAQEFKKGEWQAKKSPAVRVQLNENKPQVHLSLKKDSKGRPESVLITFIDKSGQSHPVELKAENPLNHVGYNPDGTESHFAGNLRESGQDFVGFQISIPFGSEKSEVLRFDEFERAH